MARTRDTEKYADMRRRLLTIGVDLIRSESFAAVSVGDMIKHSGIPKGSFYHYFESKEAFGLEVAKLYNEEQVDDARQILENPDFDPQTRVRDFFRTAASDYQARDFKQGCLMANLSTELADENEAFRQELKANWASLVEPLAKALELTGTEWLDLGHLRPTEAADWLMNAWTGTLTRMKAEASDAPLKLFEKAIFKD